MANLRCGAILILAHLLFANPLFKMEFMLYVECVIFALCSLTSLECFYVSHDVERGKSI